MPRVSEAHREQRRRQILTAAITCFARNGFRETTMADIAARAGVSDGLAYRYFRSKEEIIEAAVRDEGGSAPSSLVSEDGIEDFPALLELLLGSNVRRFDEPAEIKAAMNLQFRSWAEALHNEDVRQEVLARWRHHYDVVEGMVARAQTQGQIAPEHDPRAVARVMLGFHYGLNLQAVLDPDLDLEKCTEVMLAMTFGRFWKGDGSWASGDES